MALSIALPPSIARAIFPAMQESLGDRARACREHLELTQTAAAQQIGIAQAHLSQIENGQRELVRADTLRRIARAYGVTSDYLIGLTRKKR